jgi:hypothetical protein
MQTAYWLSFALSWCSLSLKLFVQLIGADRATSPVGLSGKGKQLYFGNAGRCGILLNISEIGVRVEYYTLHLILAKRPRKVLITNRYGRKFHIPVCVAPKVSARLLLSQ